MIARFLCRPKDLIWQELVLFLRFYGYKELPPGKTGGSRIKLCDRQKRIISWHKPHPTPIVKLYVIEQVITTLKENGQIKND
ncbi:type II toxin-antitoxin system HicA family toxin [Dyadobacter sp. CY261]|uniref:type II toxin-antitoxin system HicA family toxin n=1 Tax=Dyadobacter sp. CY261 TaxID=2907203 RepID=UPI001F189085|nr:type II toxin-antitoxin system HicA family toxin [Dyadobacter sp. CY261]MCF0069043.1 type II toxin-antitoxin system HicA family toxin [Dyadobacter sp. CY261]